MVKEVAMEAGGVTLMRGNLNGVAEALRPRGP
jgi:cation transport ATPase